mgnify:CR=1 FL=1
MSREQQGFEVINLFGQKDLKSLSRAFQGRSVDSEGSLTIGNSPEYGQQV